MQQPLLKAREPGLSARDVARRLERISAPLCDTQDQRLVDAEAALRHVVRASAPCP